MMNSGSVISDLEDLRRNSDDVNNNIENDINSNEHNNKDLLFLVVLGIYENRQSPPDFLDCLTARDLVQIRCLNKVVNQRLLSGIEYTKCRDGRTYQVPYPGFPGLLVTQTDRVRNAGLFPHQLASLNKIYHLENPSTTIEFGTLRGGILADAPGLGKTVTVLALIASTAGTRPVGPIHKLWKEDNIAAGWTALRTNPAFREDINRTIRPIRKWYGLHNKHIKKLIHDTELPFRGNMFLTYHDFIRHVQLILHQLNAPTSVKELFRSNFEGLLGNLDKEQRSFFATKEGQRFLLERRLLRSGATLIVVPDALLEHWFEQCLHHLRLEYFADESTPTVATGTRDEIPHGVVYIDGVGDIAEASIPLLHVNLQNTMASATDLMGYLIVVTTFSRCEHEFVLEQKAGRLRHKTLQKRNSVSNKEISRKRRRQSPKRMNSASKNSVDENVVDPLSPLLQVRWLRLIVDEGHELGSNDASGSGLVHMLHEVAAERRWVLSGTPTTGNEDNESFTEQCLIQLQRLLSFLRHPIYGKLTSSSTNSSVKLDDGDFQQHQWNSIIQKPFLERKENGRTELLRVLNQIMVLHQKNHVNLPRPIFIQSETKATVPTEIQQKVVAANDHIVANQIFTSYLETEEYQTLVDKAQGDYIVESIRKARKILEEKGGPIESHTGVRMYDDFEKKEDRRQVKAVVFSSNKAILLSVAEYLYEGFEKENVAEMWGSVGDLSSELSRFRNGFKETFTCPICFRNTDLSDCRGGNRKCREFLIEVKPIEPGYAPFLIEPERILIGYGRNLPPIGDPLYRLKRPFWEPGHQLLVDVRDPHPLMQQRHSSDLWASWVNEKQNIQNILHLGPIPDMGSSQVEVVLISFQRCGDYHSRRWYTGPRVQDAEVKMERQDTFVLCLYSEVSHGLDLSFVTNMYLLEPIEDAALLEQVTSRAHRLGATGPVTVETVNVWQDVDDKTKAAIRPPATEQSKFDSSSSSSQVLLEEQKRYAEKGVCDYCFRTFETIAKAEEHEQYKCPRNPNVIAKEDPFDLTALYREIHPPDALQSYAVTNRESVT